MYHPPHTIDATFSSQWSFIISLTAQVDTNIRVDLNQMNEYMHLKGWDISWIRNVLPLIPSQRLLIDQNRKERLVVQAFHILVKFTVIVILVYSLRTSLDCVTQLNLHVAVPMFSIPHHSFEIRQRCSSVAVASAQRETIFSYNSKQPPVSCASNLFCQTMKTLFLKIICLRHFLLSMFIPTASLNNGSHLFRVSSAEIPTNYYISPPGYCSFEIVLSCSP